MLTILIVDDEKEELEGISFLIDKLGFKLYKVFADNGNQALEYLQNHKVDILFTDIRMPRLDGLELIKLAKNENPNLKIIIYSGYADFAYAQSAINLEVSEYILKPIKVEEFEKSLKRVMERVKRTELEHELYSQTARYAQNHLLYKALNHSDSLSEADTKLLENFDICYTKLFLLEFDQSFFDIISFRFEDWIAEAIPYPFDYLNLNVSQCLLLFKGGERDMRKSFYEIAMDLYDKIEGDLGYTCYVALSSEGNRNRNLSEKFAQLERLMEYRFFVSYTRIFEEEKLLEEINTPSPGDALLLDKIRKEVSAKDFNKIYMYVDLLFQKYQNKTNYSQLYVKFVFSTLYHAIITEFGECSEDEISLYIDKLYRCSDLLGLKSILQNTLQEFEKREESSGDAGHDIDLVKKYIEKHYQEELNLYSLAEKVYLSPSYLCARFKRITGFGINKYIKNVRMERAEQLVVDTNMKIIDICEQVGYHNLSYFCQSYKEHFGKTPEKYRQHNVKEDRGAGKNKEEI